MDHHPSCHLPLDIIRIICLFCYSILPYDYSSFCDNFPYDWDLTPIYHRYRIFSSSSTGRKSEKSEKYRVIIRAYENPDCRLPLKHKGTYIHRSSNHKPVISPRNEHFKLLYRSISQHQSTLSKYEIIKAEVSLQFPSYSICSIYVLFHTKLGFRADLHHLTNDRNTGCVSAYDFIELHDREGCPDRSRWIYIVECHIH